MQTVLPSMIAISEKNSQLNYGKSHTGNVHNSDSIIEGYQYRVYASIKGFRITLVTKLSRFYLYSDSGMYWC